MRVFISGVAGLLGSHLADAFLNRGDSVFGVDNLIGGYRDNIPSRCVFSEVDCNDFLQLKELMQTSKPDLVYHCAATAYEGLSVFSPHLVTQNIVTATTGMISAAIASGVRRFVLCSSMARYGIGIRPPPFTEDMRTLPRDPYGIGKVCSEELLINLADTHGMEWVIAVPHNIIGPRQKYDDPFRNVAAIFINRMLQGKQPIIYGNGEQRRCFSFINDVVEPLIQLGVQGPCHGQVFNIGPDGEFVTINELANTIMGLLAEGFGLSRLTSIATPIYVPDRPQEVREANCSADKARRWLGYAPKTSLRDGLSEMIAWIRDRGPREFDYRLPLEIVSELTPKTWTKRLI